MEEIKCLNHGFVRLVDSMPGGPYPEGMGDAAIVQAARVSYGSGVKTPTEDRALIRFLLRHRHTTPFEQVTLKFHAKMPIFVARQWVRHRTAALNEVSGRYSIMKDEFYTPEAEQVRAQSKTNKQGRDEELPELVVKDFLEHLSEEQKGVYQGYESAYNNGIAKEMARINLPLSLYTEWYWTINLHNLFHFIGLRSDSHAQYEIRVYSDAMLKLITPLAPWAVEAFNEYHPYRRARIFSGTELRILKGLISFFKGESGLEGSTIDHAVSIARAIAPDLPTRELTEFLEKIG